METELSVVVLFSDIERTTEYFKALKSLLDKETGDEGARLREKVLNVTYIGSDSWSSDQKIFTRYHGVVFRKFIGVGVYTKDIEGFRDYLQTLNSTNYNSIYDNTPSNYFVKWYNEYTEKKNWTETIRDSKFDDHSSTTADATYAFGQGLLEYIKRKRINSSLETVTSDLFDVLKGISFTSLTGNEVSFGSNNQQVGRYYIVGYEDGAFQRVGNYSANKLVYNNPYQNTPSICSAPCKGGQRRKSTSPCCHECVDCAQHEFSDGTTTMCSACNQTYTHNEEHTGCIAVTPDYISFTSTFAIILYILLTGGLVAVAGIVTIFVAKFHTPVVQGHGVFVYVTLLATCVLLLASTLLFLGESSDWNCNLRLAVPVLGVSSLFLCVSCLTKTVILKLRALQITKFYIIQLLILVTGLVTQVLIIGLVLFFRPMKYEKREINRGKVYGECNFKSDTPRMDILLYISCFVIFVGSLILSFMGRNINENYNEGKFLAFQTIAMHIVIVAFIPTIMLLEGPVLSGAWAVTTVIMCFIVLIVLFTPKLYIIIYRPYKNQFIEELLPEIPRTNGVIREEDSLDL